MKRFFKIFLIILGLLILGLVVFVTLRIRENDRKAALRQSEAEKRQISQAEAQLFDLGGFAESDFRELPLSAGAASGPAPEQWRALRQALSVTSPALGALLPEQSPVVAPGFERIRYAVRPEGWRLLVDCRPAGGAGVNGACEPVAVAAATLSEAEIGEWQESVAALAPEGAAVYGALHGRRGTEGMDKLINEGNMPMIYNEFCTELGCNGSVNLVVDKVMFKVEGGGNLQPWYAALAQSGGAGGKKR